MLPTNTAVKIDDPEDPKVHGKQGFVLYNKYSGVVEKCENCRSLEECQEKGCENGERLTGDWHIVVLDPMATNGFSHCKEWVHEDNLVVNGC